MKIFATLVMLGMLTLPAMAATEAFKDVPVVDVNCSRKIAANPDSHTRTCAITCQKSGFGIITRDKQFVKFDSKGNEEILTELKASGKKDHLRVNVTGDVEGDTLKVTSVKLL